MAWGLSVLRIIVVFVQFGFGFFIIDKKMCKCETGCTSQRCGCKQTRKAHCGPSCRCIGCEFKPPIGCKCSECTITNLPGDNNPELRALKTQVASMENTVHQAISAVKEFQEAQLGQQSTTVVLLSDSRYTAGNGNQSDAMVVPQPMTTMTTVTSPDIHSYSNRFTFVSTGGVMNFFADLEKEKFFLMKSDDSNRLYGWYYPGTQQVGMQLWVQGLPDFTTDVKVVSPNNEILNEFVKFLINKYR